MSYKSSACRTVGFLIRPYKAQLTGWGCRIRLVVYIVYVVGAVGLSYTSSACRTAQLTVGLGLVGVGLSYTADIVSTIEVPTIEVRFDDTERRGALFRRFETAVVGVGLSYIVCVVGLSYTVGCLIKLS